jgi:DNA-binding response OmpR family regulator
MAYNMLRVRVCMEQWSVLVVEDDPDTAEFLELLLSQAGYHVTLARSGRDGLARARKHAPTAVLLDYRLPDMFGVDVCHQLRAEQGPDMPIIIMSADGPIIEPAARAAGATAFLHKPLAPDVLLELLAAHLSQM